MRIVSEAMADPEAIKTKEETFVSAAFDGLLKIVTRLLTEYLFPTLCYLRTLKL